MPSGKPVKGDQIVLTSNFNPGAMRPLRHVEFTGTVKAYTLTNLSVQ